MSNISDMPSTTPAPSSAISSDIVPEKKLDSLVHNTQKSIDEGPQSSSKNAEPRAECVSPLLSSDQFFNYLWYYCKGWKQGYFPSNGCINLHKSVFVAQLDVSLLSFARDFFNSDMGKPASLHAQSIYIFSGSALFSAIVSAAVWTLMYSIVGLRTLVISRASAVFLVVLSLSLTAAETLYITIILQLRQGPDVSIGYILPSAFVGVILLVLLFTFWWYFGFDIRAFLDVCCGGGNQHDAERGTSSPAPMHANPNLTMRPPSYTPHSQ